MPRNPVDQSSPLGPSSSIPQPIESDVNDDSFDCNLLIVDDEPTNVLLLRHILEKAGYANVHTTTDSFQVVPRCKTDTPDLILLDLHMPTPDGYAILAELADLLEPEEFLPVVILTADTTTSARDRALRLGATDFITKPFDTTEVVLRVRNLLSTRLAHRRLRLAKVLLDDQVHALIDHNDQDIQRHRRITQRVSRAAQGDGMQMLFQPIVDLTTGLIIGVEALARFTALPLQPPEAWFAEAAEVGFALQLEMAAIRAALAQADHLPSGAFLSVNASPNAIRSHRLATELSHHPATAVVLELTEQQFVGDERQLSDAIDQLRREHGVRLAIDDTGEGYASLSRILRLHPDLIKINRFLIAGIDHDPVRQSLTSSLVDLSQQMGATLIAEGIETADELTTLRELGVPQGQGSLLQRPGTLPFDADARQDKVSGAVFTSRDHE